MMEQLRPDPGCFTTCAFCELVQTSYLRCSDVRVIGLQTLDTILEHARVVHGVRLESLTKVISK